MAELGRAVQRIAVRGETVLPAAAGPGRPQNLADALAALQTVSERIHALLAEHAPDTVRALQEAPGSAPVGTGVHTTLVAMEGLLAQQHTGRVTLNRRHEDDISEDSDAGFDCCCDIMLHTDQEEYIFYYGDGGWTVLRESDARHDDDGSTVYSAFETLSVSLKTAHPQQLTDSVLQIIANDQPQPADFTAGLCSVGADRS